MICCERRAEKEAEATPRGADAAGEAAHVTRRCRAGRCALAVLRARATGEGLAREAMQRSFDPLDSVEDESTRGFIVRQACRLRVPFEILLVCIERLQMSRRDIEAIEDGAELSNAVRYSCGARIDAWCQPRMDTVERDSAPATKPHRPVTALSVRY